MNEKIFEEKILKPASGFFMLIILVIGFFASIATFVYSIVELEGENFLSGGIFLIATIIVWMALCILPAGLKIVRPNEARIFVLFGAYHGTVKASGYYYVNPFCASFSPAYNTAKTEAAAKRIENPKQTGPMQFDISFGTKSISLKKQTLDNKRQKVNDVLGNPIIIGAIVIWHVENPTQAVFSVENYHEYLSIQTDSVIRNVSRLYPYDIFGEDENDDGIREKTLRGSALEIAETMTAELRKRVSSAGLEIDEVRITHLAYAEEIAAAMLQRQQASAIIAARQKIVDGAVGMVKMAIDKLSEDDVVHLDDERKAAMVSNLLVVLCGNKDAQPIVNSGTIY